MWPFQSARGFKFNTRQNGIQIYVNIKRKPMQFQLFALSEDVGGDQ